MTLCKYTEPILISNGSISIFFFEKWIEYSVSECSANMWWTVKNKNEIVFGYSKKSTQCHKWNKQQHEK